MLFTSFQTHESEPATISTSELITDVSFEVTELPPKPYMKLVSPGKRKDLQFRLGYDETAVRMLREAQMVAMVQLVSSRSSIFPLSTFLSPQSRKRHKADTLPAPRSERRSTIQSHPPPSLFPTSYSLSSTRTTPTSKLEPTCTTTSSVAPLPLPRTQLLNSTAPNPPSQLPSTTRRKIRELLI